MFNYAQGLPMPTEDADHTKKRVSDKKRRFLRKRAKAARKTTRKHRKH